MPWLGTITVVGLIALAVLVWLFIRTRNQDLLEEFAAKRRSSSRLVSRADYVEGMEHIAVALALTADCIYYENPDLQASLELERIEEIEYDDETATGHHVRIGKALRLRSHGHTFEFLLSAADARQWEANLPARRYATGAAQAV